MTRMATPVPIAERCAAHPGRPAVDHCPVCDRPRCGADDRPTGCSICSTDHPMGLVRRKAPPLELLVRASLGAYATAIAWAYVAAEYVGAGLFQYFAPALLGILCGGAASAAAGSPRRGPLVRRVQVVSVLHSLLGAALGFRLEGTYSPFSLHPDVLLPFLITAAAAWFWTTPPKARVKRPE